MSSQFPGSAIRRALGAEEVAFLGGGKLPARPQPSLSRRRGVQPQLPADLGTLLTSRSQVARVKKKSVHAHSKTQGLGWV